MKWVPLDTSRGVNLHDDARALRKGEYRYGKNLVPVPSGVLSKRGGLERPWTFTNTPGQCVIPSPILPNATGTSDVLVVFSGSDLSSCALEGRIAGIEAVTPVSSGPSALHFYSRRPWLFPWNNRAYLLPGPYAAWSGPTGPLAYRFDETSQSTQTSLVLAGSGNEDIHPLVASPFRVRMVYGNLGAGRKNTLIFTDDYTDNVVGNDVLAVNGRAVSLVSGDDGDEIWAMTEVMLSAAGTPAQAALLVLRRVGNPFLLTGDLDQSTGGTSTLVPLRMHIAAGCASPWTVATTPYGVIWAGKDDVWFYREGALPYPVGTKLKPIFGYAPPAEHIRMTGTYFDGFYRLQAFGQGQDLSAPPTQQWWLDLREGPPQDWRDARWYGPIEYLGVAEEDTTALPGLVAMTVAGGLGTEKQLIYMANTQFAAGFPATKGYALGVVGDSPRDLAAATATISDTAFVGSEVLAELRTGEVIFSPGNQQSNDGILLAVRALDDVALTGTVALDNGSSAPATKHINPTPFRLGSNQLDVDPLAVKAQSVAIYPNLRQAGDTHQFTLADEAGYVITAGFNDTLVIGPGVWDATPDQKLLTIPAGVYTLTELVAAIEAAAILNSDGIVDAVNLAAYDLDVKILGTGIVRFDDTPNPSFGQLTINFTDNTLTANAFATAAQLLVSRRLGAILGLDTSATQNFAGDGSGSPAVLFDGVVAPFQNGVAMWEMYGLQANMDIIPRVG